MLDGSVVWMKVWENEEHLDMIVVFRCFPRDVTQVIAPEKDSIIVPPSTPPGNDLNIVVESGSSWIDYIGPLTSDEIDSDKR
ncbi:hypothetical protein Tco_0122596 [Tanacetum coccineum]